VLCTDGDFNVGVTGDALVDEVVSWRERGITLSVFGYGHGNFNDSFLERLTNEGEGTYRFIDSPNEALRAVGADLVAGMEVIAKDVKIQVEFAPEQVARFRLIGYVNRVLAHEDFTNDAVDAGEIGAGHFVTAFYELELAAERGEGPLATVRLRHKAPEGGDSIETAHEAAAGLVAETFEMASADFRFGAAVTEFAEILHHSEHCDGADFAQVKAIAQGALDEPTPDRSELIELVERAAGLWPAE
ncbi:MAG: DUF3520 domain-containing protein, partial [Myxococcales bacterium]|nr:DUF3520 domain-containing protein [Myxococcales bacterium]